MNPLGQLRLQLFSVIFMAVVVAALAIAVGQAAGQEEPKLPSKEIKAQAAGPRGWGKTGTFYVRLAARGAPPTKDARLTDDTGKNAATAVFTEDLAGGPCTNLKVRDTGLGRDRWCVRIVGLEPGSEPTGEASNGRMTLKLKASIRHNFLWLPLAVGLLSLGLAVGLTYGITEWVPSRWARWSVDRAVARADIERLSEWVEERRKTTSDTTLRPLLRELVSSGPTTAAQARHRLTTALATSPLPDGHPLRNAAIQEASRTNHTIGDFYGDDGEKKERHPADERLATLNRASGIYTELSHARAAIDALEHPAGGLNKLYADAVQRLGEASDDAALETADAVVDDLWDRIRDSIVDDEGLRDKLLRRFGLGVRADEREREGVAEGGVRADEREREGVAEGAIVAPEYSTLPDLTIERRLPSVLAPMLVVGLPLMAVAIGGLASTVYIPSKTFGVWADYLTLAIAGTASSTAAGIASVLLILRIKKA